MESAESDKPTVINTHVDPAIRVAMNAFMDDYNAKGDGKHNIRTVTEAALKGWLASRGFWPWPPERPAAKPATRKRGEKAGAA